MKKVILFAAFMLAACYGFSQGPSYPINYQAVVRNGSGTLVPNGSTVNFRFSILEGSASGAVLYSETQSALVNNNQGLVNLAVGEGTAIVGVRLWAANFSDNTKDKYLQVEIDPAGGTSFTTLGASKLQGVPYANNALFANYALNAYWAKATTAATDIYFDGGNVNIGTSTPTGTSKLNVEESTSDHVVSVTQTGTAGAGYRAAVYGKNNATGGNGIGVIGQHAGDGWGVYGAAAGTYGVGVYANAPIGMKAVTSAANGISLELDGFLKVSGSKKTAFKTSGLAASAGNITLSYSGASSNDILLITPIYNASVLPVAAVYWNTAISQWQIYSATTGVNFPVGCSFNVLIIKQ